jgi:hypothetical protein
MSSHEMSFCEMYGRKMSGMQKVRDMKGPDILGPVEFCPVIDMWRKTSRIFYSYIF